MTQGPAARRWREQLQAWTIPQHLLDAAPDSPYGWPTSLWRRRAAVALASDRQTPTTETVTRLAGPGGTVLDIGAGTGRASLPLAKAGHPVTAVEPSATMLEGLRDAGAGLTVTVIDGRWPESARLVATHCVAMCAHVVFDVADIGPFLIAMDDVASAGVVIEMTDRHPWVHLGPYYLALHGLDRPLGPTWEDLVQVIKEAVGVEPEVERWARPTDLWFQSMGEIIEFYGRRLLIGSDRWAELESLLKPDIVIGPGGLQVGTEDRSLSTVWWARS